MAPIQHFLFNIHKTDILGLIFQEAGSTTTAAITSSISGTVTTVIHIGATMHEWPVGSALPQVSSGPHLADVLPQGMTLGELTINVVRFSHVHLCHDIRCSRCRAALWMHGVCLCDEAALGGTTLVT